MDNTCIFTSSQLQGVRMSCANRAWMSLYDSSDDTSRLFKIGSRLWMSAI